ncbi:MAG: cobalamin-binding protein [Ignavibacteria bacterium]|nr:cobalamin-binding protein [Ignavibacteria bacterium]
MKINFNNVLKFCLLISLIFHFEFCADKEKDSKLDSKIVDDLGEIVELKAVPQYVISTAPNLTEILFKLGLGSKVIGVTRFCNYPPEAQSKEIIGDLLTMNFEKIVSLKPDLLFMTVEGNTKESYDKLRALGIKVFVSNPRDLNGINKTIKDISKIFHIESVADSLIQNYNTRLAKVKADVGKRNIKGMFLISLTPIMLAGNQTFINELLAYVGVKNIAGDSKVPYPLFSREEIVIQNPEIIIMTGEKDFSKEFFANQYKEWKNIRAIKENNIIVVNADMFLRPGPRYIDAVEILNSKINSILERGYDDQ